MNPSGNGRRAAAWTALALVAAAAAAGPWATGREARLLVWLMTPMSGESEHRLPPWAAWHGRLMVLGWGIAVPLGILVARYFKVTPGQDWPRVLDNKYWWAWHRGLQYAAMAAAAVGLLLAWRNAAGVAVAARWHALGGWTLMALGLLQVTGGWLRGTKGGPTDPRSVRGDLSGDHYDMTRRRIAFEVIHKGGGYLALALSAAIILLGLVAADAPRWMVVVMLLWWALLGLGTIVFQRSGRCIDTYQAIWGDDPSLPGLRFRPIGLGVRRRSRRA